MVDGLRDGTHRLEWWETWTGKPQRAQQVEVKGGKLTLSIPELKTDVALKIREPNRGAVQSPRRPE